MATVYLVLLIVSLACLTADCRGFQRPLEKSYCWNAGLDEDGGLKISCQAASNFTGTLGDLIKTGEGYDFGENASQITTLELSRHQVIVKINDDGLAGLVNLKKFHAKQWLVTLDISSNAFLNSPKLKEIKLHGSRLNETTMRAFENLKDSLEILDFEDVVTPHDNNVLHLISKCRKLQSVTVDCKIVEASRPTTSPPLGSIFTTSASTLRSIDLWALHWPDKLTSDMFRGMRALVTLKINYAANPLQIEPGAFDDLVSLRQLSMGRSRLRATQLPDGLFNNMRKLEEVQILEPFKNYETCTIDVNLSKSNFTHVENFQEFKIDDDMMYCTNRATNS